ncbi:hypothetical protein GCM10025857_07850 [Alicyclobacillus contaminans]|uniref:DUF4149 domain-containing protein n=1 Tax=Alicyclobacillus contaminans TaxID=392016 RepID=UPI00146FBA17|nr:DUF4149 domain-containing protein [Alicyclobacillus contaminans]GMA49428.1 hypothetical protein GCM10025857_07850 [Alicyclobacillus contaminans]
MLNRILTAVGFTAAALWLGAACYFTLFAASELFSALPVDTAGQAVGALFPTFFSLCTILSLVAVLAFYALLRRMRRVTRTYRGFLWVGLLGMVLNAVNQFYMLPNVQRLEAKMGSISKATPALAHQFYTWHGISMGLELLAVLAAAALFVSMAALVRWPFDDATR